MALTRISTEPGRNSVFWHESPDATTYWEVLASLHGGRRFLSILNDGWVMVEWMHTDGEWRQSKRQSFGPAIPEEVLALLKQAKSGEVL